MNPGISAVLNPFLNGQGFVMSVVIGLVGVMIEYTGPDQCHALFGYDSDIQVGKLGSTPLEYMVEIEIYGENPGSALSTHLVRYVIVVGLIELSGFVFQQLERFSRTTVRFWVRNLSQSS